MTNYDDPQVHREHIFIFVAYSSSSLYNLLLLMQKSCLYKLFKIVKVDTKVSAIVSENHPKEREMLDD